MAKILGILTGCPDYVTHKFGITNAIVSTPGLTFLFQVMIQNKLLILSIHWVWWPRLLTARDKTLLTSSSEGISYWSWQMTTLSISDRISAGSWSRGFSLNSKSDELRVRWLASTPDTATQAEVNKELQCSWESYNWGYYSWSKSKDKMHSYRYMCLFQNYPVSRFRNPQNAGWSQNSHAPAVNQPSFSSNHTRHS